MTSSSDNNKNESARLKLTVKPTHYDLVYTRIDLENFVFSGTCSLHCTGLPPSGTSGSNESSSSSVLQLHALELQIVSATMKKKQADVAAAAEETTTTTSEQKAISYRYHQRNQTVDIAFAEAFQADEDYVVVMDFIGVLNDQMCGLYRSVYTDIYGNSKIMATTQFEATDARRAFPCMDEPALKATFQLTVTIPAELQCLSNTPMAASHTTVAAGPGSKAVKTITFQKTPKMSTYLLALVVGEFDGISRTSSSSSAGSQQIVTTVYTVPGKADQAEFCLDTASRCLDLYQELFHVPYPLTKSDLIAIPDFAAGAMVRIFFVLARVLAVLDSRGYCAGAALVLSCQRRTVSFCLLFRSVFAFFEFLCMLISISSCILIVRRRIGEGFFCFSKSVGSVGQSWLLCRSSSGSFVSATDSVFLPVVPFRIRFL